MRHADVRRGKGKRGGLRVMYFWWPAGGQFWLFTLYDKDGMDDLTPRERAALKSPPAPDQGHRSAHRGVSSRWP